jgi:hypothetical protein
LEPARNSPLFRWYCVIPAIRFSIRRLPTEVMMKQLDCCTTEPDHRLHRRDLRAL